jgi:hypothetical protein
MKLFTRKWRPTMMEQERTEAEMATEEFKSCTYEGKVYPSGAELCVADRCMVCRDGKWIEEGIS